MTTREIKESLYKLLPKSLVEDLSNLIPIETLRHVAADKQTVTLEFHYGGIPHICEQFHKIPNSVFCDLGKHYKIEISFTTEKRGGADYTLQYLPAFGNMFETLTVVIKGWISKMKKEPEVISSDNDEVKIISNTKIHKPLELNPEELQKGFKKFSFSSWKDTFKNSASDIAKAHEEYLDAMMKSGQSPFPIVSGRSHGKSYFNRMYYNHPPDRDRVVFVFCRRESDYQEFMHRGYQGIYSEGRTKYARINSHRDLMGRDIDGYIILNEMPDNIREYFRYETNGNRIPLEEYMKRRFGRDCIDLTNDHRMHRNSDIADRWREEYVHNHLFNPEMPLIREEQKPIKRAKGRRY